MDERTDLDAEVLEAAIQLVEDWLDTNRRQLPASRKAAVIVKIYEFVMAEDSGIDQVSPAMLEQHLSS